MKRNLLSWASTLMLLLMGLVQVAQAQTGQNNKNKPTEGSYISKKHTKDGGFEIEYKSAVADSGFVTLKFAIHSTKGPSVNENIEAVYFELPVDAGVISPVGFYYSKLNGNGKPNTSKKYRVFSAVKEPFNAVKFEGVGGESLKSKQRFKNEEFEFVLSEVEFAQMETIKVAIKSSTSTTLSEQSFNAIPSDNARLSKLSKTSVARTGTVNTLETCFTLPDISGPSDPCPGDEVTFAVRQSSAYTVEWTVPDLGADNQPSNWKITAEWIADGNHYIRVLIGDISATVYARIIPTNTNCESQIVSKPTYIGDKIPVSLTVNNGEGNGLSDYEFTKNSLIVFNANAVPSREKRDYVYDWVLPAGWYIIWGAGTSSVVVQTSSTGGMVEVNVSSKFTSESGIKIRYCGLGYDNVEMFADGSECGPEIVIEGPEEVCTSGVYKYEIAEPADPSTGVKYDFFLPDNMELVSKGYGYVYARLLYGTVGKEINVSAVARGANNCISAVACFPVTIGDCPTECTSPTSPSLAIPSQLCNIRNFTFTLQGMQTGVTYDFEFPEGFVIDNFNPETGELSVDIIFDENTSLPIQQTLVVIATNECSSVAYEQTVTVGDCDAGEPLPVTLTSFGGTSRNGSVELAWSTASEINNDRFEVERSADGKSFKKVGEVKGNGNSSVLVDYTYTDHSAASGTVYYRLKQVDYDSQFEYSKVIAVSHTASASTASMSVYPNPVEDGKVSLRFQNQVEGSTSIRLTDMSGRVLLVKEVGNVGAEHELNLTGLNLKAGIYMISVTANGQSTTQRIMVR